MNELQDFLPASRSWRDIPQQVKPRAMSREGRRRYFFSGIRTAATVVVLALLAVGGVWLARTWSSDPAWFSAASGQPALKNIKLETNGHLNEAWVRRTLALPAKVTLMEVDPYQLTQRLKQSPQVEWATVTKILPEGLSIRLTERVPAARLRLDNGEIRLVGRDGVVFSGEGYTGEELDAYPVLLGAASAASGAAPGRIDGMAPVVDLIAKARDLTPGLYETWKEIDIGRQSSDGLIEVHATDVPRILISTENDLSSQLTKLSQVLILAPGPMKLVDVSLGQRVTAEPAIPEPAEKAGRRPAAAPPATVSAATPKPLFQIISDR